MRLDRRWWTFGLTVFLAWGAWFALRSHRPRPVAAQAGGEERPEPGPAVAGVTDRGGPSGRGDLPASSGSGSAASTDPDAPPAPAEPARVAEGPGRISGLEDLSPATGAPPAPTEPAGPDDAVAAATGPGPDFPGLDEAIERAAAPSPSNPATAEDIRLGDRAQRGGKLADAERHFLAAVDRPGPFPVEAKQRLAEVYWLQGRFDEVRDLAEEIWRESNRVGARRESRAMLQFHLALGLNPLPIDRMQSTLDRAVERAPMDDRVWLGRANLALRDGRLIEAKSWLDACRQRRPDDPAVWRARLEWAIAADRVDEARAALPHLRLDQLPSARLHELRAWFAAQGGDAEAERQALESAVRVDPGDAAALERLAELAARAGRADESLRLRRRKAELDDTLHRYRTLFRDDDPVGSTAEMARLAEVLGRRFEAIGLWTLVREMAPAEDDARAALERLAQPGPQPERPASSPTVAEILGREPASAPSRRTTAASPDPAATARRVVPRFRDDAGSAGLHFTFANGQSLRRQLPEASSGGVGLLDYDGDGRLDVYLVQGGPFPPKRPDVQAPGDGRDARAPSGDRLFRNRGDGTFEDVTRASALAAMKGGYGHGVAVGDYDNDGRPDLFVTRWRSYALYHNRGDGTFEDATGTAGLGGDRDWPTSSAFADLDGDGDLDLYVCHYLAWDAENPEVCRSPSSGRVNPCDPLRFAARPDHLFRNDGGRFVDVTREAGIVDRDGRGLGVVATDLDEDGKVDLFVANDGTANFLFLNRGGMRFEEAGHISGVAAAGGGGYRAGMGIACGDLDGDGRPDLAVTNFFGESTTFYQNLGGGLFTDRTAAVGLAAPSRYRLGFGIAFLDADDDGRLDLLTVNGHIADERPEIPYAMPAQLMLGGADARLTDVSAAAGAPFQVPRLGRGLAIGDVDNDGRVDAIVLGHEGPVAYFHNAGPGGHSITLRLEGRQSNRDAIGARVVVEAGGRRQAAGRFGGGSYQSAGDPRLRFGLGTATRVDALEVHWPSGRVDRFRDLAADAGFLIREGDATIHLLPGWTPQATTPGAAARGPR